MSKAGDLYDVLFEVSNEIRHKILLSLEERTRNITQLSKIFDMSFPEISRHVSRLGEVLLTKKDVDGFHHITPFGEVVLKQLRELGFTSRHREYFSSHSMANLPLGFIRRIGDLNESTFTAGIMDFMYSIETIIKEGEEHVWFIVDQYPVTALSSIIEAIGRGVEFRIIEPEDHVAGPHLILQVPDEAQALSRVRSTPLLEQRTSDRVDVILYLSDKRCALAFPDINGEYDYLGFIATDERALEWCRDLFLHFWEEAEPKVYVSPTEYVRPPRVQLAKDDTARRIVVEGHDDSRVDARAVQEAVDNYDEVVMRGTFNLGTSSILIRKSVVIKGEGREQDVPLTKVYKKGWTFPFTEWDYIFCVDGESANVTIENIHFTDFNCSCILGLYGNSLNIENNVITLFTGYGRGWRFGSYGDIVLGIWIDTPFEHMHKRIRFMDGVSISGNHLDFAYGSASPLASYVPIGPSEKDPENRPDLFNHESYIGIGINVLNVSGEAVIENNTVRNMNARGICAQDNFDTAEVYIRYNVVESDVYGCYPFYGPDAGFGIAAQSAFLFPRPSFNIVIEENVIELSKPNYSGIGVYGPTIDREGVDKLYGGSVRKNRIHLNDGHVGIHIRKSDEFEVSDNAISGEAYYGIQVSGRRKSGALDLRAIDNVVENNDMKGLKIKEPDVYSDNHADGRIFANSQGRSATANVWMNPFSRDNVIKVRADETVIDEGEDNKITYVDNE